MGRERQKRVEMCDLECFLMALLLQSEREIKKKQVHCGGFRGIYWHYTEYNMHYYTFISV